MHERHASADHVLERAGVSDCFPHSSVIGRTISPGDRMPRNTTKPEYVLAMTASATARALGIRPERVAEALDAGHLVARQLNGRGKALIPIGGPQGTEAWFLSWPISKRRKSP
jgi:hypothetical protein